METATIHRDSITAYSNYDPTRTTVLRNAFAREMRKRFNELARVIRKAIVDEDCFGLKAGFYQMTTPGGPVFTFPRSADKVTGFMTWLQQQIDRGILEIRELPQVGIGIEEAWTNKYISDSYKRGVMRARYEMQKAGFDVPSIDQTGGIEISLSTPFHIDRLGLLYSRTFSGLQGITVAMDTQISRVLAQGIADGDNPILLARKLISTINGTGMGDLAITDTLGRFIPARRRAEMLARTEIIRAHHQATIQEYRNWAIEGVVVKAEWSSVGDDGRTCNECLDLEGSVWTLDEIEKMIPRHPNCRCCALPYKDTGELREPREPLGEKEQIIESLRREVDSTKNADLINKLEFYHATGDRGAFENILKRGIKTSVDEANSFPGISLTTDLEYARGYGEYIAKINVRTESLIKVDPSFWNGTSQNLEHQEIYRMVRRVLGKNPSTAEIGDFSNMIHRAGHDGWFTISGEEIGELRIFFPGNIVELEEFIIP